MNTWTQKRSILGHHGHPWVPGWWWLEPWCLLWLSIPIGSMVLLYMVTWIPSMSAPVMLAFFYQHQPDPSWDILGMSSSQLTKSYFSGGAGQPPTSCKNGSLFTQKNRLNGKIVRKNHRMLGAYFQTNPYTSSFFFLASNHNGTKNCMTLNTVLIGTYWNNILVSQIFLLPPKASSVAQYIIIIITQEFSAGDADHLSCRDQRGLVAGGSETAEDLPRTESGFGDFSAGAKKRNEGEYILCSDMFR